MWYTAFSVSQCFVFSCQVVKLLVLNLLSIFFFLFYFKNRKGVFFSGWKCGTHVNGFPVSEQLEHRVHWSLHVMWWPTGLHCWPVPAVQPGSAHSWLCWKHRINHGFSGKRVWYPACCWCSPLQEVLMRVICEAESCWSTCGRLVLFLHCL